MDTEIFTAFNTLNKKLDDHANYSEKRMDSIDLKLRDVCNYIKNKKEAKSEKSQTSNKRLYIAIAVIGVSFGIVEIIQGLM